MVSADFSADFFTSVGNTATSFLTRSEPATPAVYEAPPVMAGDPNTYAEPAKPVAVPAANDCFRPTLKTHQCDNFDDTKAKFINVCVDQESPGSGLSPMKAKTGTAN